MKEFGYVEQLKPESLVKVVLAREVGQCCQSCNKDPAEQEKQQKEDQDTVKFTGCMTGKKPKMLAYNGQNLNLQVGDVVEIKTHTLLMMYHLFLAIIMPLALIVIGYSLAPMWGWYTVGTRISTAGLGFFLGLTLAWALTRGKKNQRYPHILRLAEESEIPVFEDPEPENYAETFSQS